MPLKDFNKYMAEPLGFPLNGKVYTVPSPSLEVGLKMASIFKEDDDESPVQDQWQLVLGAAYTEMVADNVPIEFVSRAFLTAVADFNYGRDMAEATWEAGTNPEALAAWFEKNRAKSKDSTSTDEAN